MAQLALDHVQRHALVRHLHRVGVAELMRRKPSPDPGLTAKRRNWVRAAGADHGWPAVGPLTTQKSGPTGSATRC